MASLDTIPRHKTLQMSLILSTNIGRLPHAEELKLRQSLQRSEFLFPGSQHSSMSFPDGSVGKEPTCSSGDLGLIPGSGRYYGEGTGYPLQCSWASLVVQLVKNPPAMGETWVRPLGWEDPLEKGKATHSSIMIWRMPWTVHGVSKSWTQLGNFHFSLPGCGNSQQ